MERLFEVLRWRARRGLRPKHEDIRSERGEPDIDKAESEDGRRSVSLPTLRVRAKHRFKELPLKIIFYFAARDFCFDRMASEDASLVSRLELFELP